MTIKKNLDSMSKEELKQYLKQLEEQKQIRDLKRRIRELENPVREYYPKVIPMTIWSPQDPRQPYNHWQHFYWPIIKY